MNAKYPIMLRLEGKKAVVIGGGRVAERKVKGLLETGAEIVVVSPDATGELQQLSAAKKISWLEKSFSEEDLEGAVLVFSATNDAELNQIVKNSAAPHQLISIADDPETSDFHVPAQLQRGRLSIAISTDGASPTLAGEIRKQLEEKYDESFEEYLEFLFSARKRILTEVHDPDLKRKLLSAIASSEFFHSNDWEKDFAQILKMHRNN
jgi:precorrin-2 dehydrogenase/sirohydrochlorin ferrochelatase